ncbi:MAG: hypothetical protein KC619_10260 [Myxococcales bacterium]|nr:hypothetical protein [Myxococcales bacterium]
MRHAAIALSALCLGGCYLAHSIEGPTAPDLSMDAGAPTVDAGPARSDAGPPRRDAGVDAGVVPGPGPGPDARCVLPVEPFGVDDGCQPETGACIERCGSNRLCIVGCLQRDEVCRICAVRNALSCFNEETSCGALYPEVSCCIVDNCAATVIDDVLNVCTALACDAPFNRYADCAVTRTADRCRRAVARCGLPPTLLGLDG